MTVDILPPFHRTGSLVRLNLNVKNGSDAWVKDITIYCEFYGASGTKISHKSVVAYRDFAPKKATRLRNIDFGFVHDEVQSVGCKVDGVVRGSPV